MKFVNRKKSCKIIMKILGAHIHIVRNKDTNLGTSFLDHAWTKSFLQADGHTDYQTYKRTYGHAKSNMPPPKKYHLQNSIKANVFEFVNDLALFGWPPSTLSCMDWCDLSVNCLFFTNKYWDNLDKSWNLSNLSNVGKI